MAVLNSRFHGFSLLAHKHSFKFGHLHLVRPITSGKHTAWITNPVSLNNVFGSYPANNTRPLVHTWDKYRAALDQSWPSVFTHRKKLTACLQSQPGTFLFYFFLSQKPVKTDAAERFIILLTLVSQKSNKHRSAMLLLLWKDSRSPSSFSV